MRALGILFTAAALALGAAACGGDGDDDQPASIPETMRLESPAFEDGGTIPARFTCDGRLGGVNPPLEWSLRPRDTKSQALVVMDPDASGGTFVHWTVWRMMARTTGLQPDIPPIGLPQGKNSAGRDGYAPPCPPRGEPPHRYEFAIYALEAPIDAKPGAPAAEVIDEIEDAALARGVLTGRYSR